MLTGTPPFLYSDPLEIVHAHLSQEPAPPSQRNSRISPELSELTLKLLSKAPEDRYQTAMRLMQDLRRLEGNTAIEFLPDRDRLNRINIPEKLYGRCKQLEMFQNEFDEVVKTGHARMLLISGRSGVGKSAFVHTLCESPTRDFGFFVSGKFEQYKRDVPFVSRLEKAR